MRLPASKLSEYKRVMMQKQQFKCAICNKVFTQKDDAVVDHCHITGMLRGALHRSCNGVEGKVLSAAARMTKGHGVSAVIEIAIKLSLREYVPKVYLPLFRLAARCHKGIKGDVYMQGLGMYYKDWQTPKHNLIHPSHHMDFEKKTADAGKVNWRNKDGTMAKTKSKPLYLPKYK